MKESAIIIFHHIKKKISVDVEIPLDITANDFVIAMNQAFDLQMDTNHLSACYLKCENPIALLRGNKTLQEFGVRDGSIINYTD